MFRGRRERAVRERGRPATGVVRASRRWRGRWIVLVTVTPEDGEPFDTHLQVTALDGAEPRPGDFVEVLHHGGHALPLYQPTRFRAPPAEPATDAAVAEDAHGGADPESDADPPRPEDVIGQVLRRLADGSLTSGGPRIVIDEPPAGGPPDDGPRPTIADLVARAPGDPDRVADEILRRIITGETTFTRVLDATRAAGPGGAAAARTVLASLRTRGLLGEHQHAMLDRLVG